MKLDSRQLNQLHQALLGSFDRDALRMMVRLQLDENLEAIAGDDDLATVVFDLVTWAERTNRVGDLVSGALAANPNNPELQQLAADYARWRAAAPAVQPAAAPVTLPVERTRGASWVLPAVGVLLVLLVAAFLLRPYLFRSARVEPTPIGPTPVVEPPATEVAGITPSPAPSATFTPEATVTWTPEPSSTPTATPSATATQRVIVPPIKVTLVVTDVAPLDINRAPRAPALEISSGLTAFNEESRLLTIKSGDSLSLDMRRLWSAPEGTPVDCASGLIVASWQVRQPYPGGDDLEIRRTLPRGGGQTELLGRGARGNVTLGYCDELSLQNLGLEEYRLEWRYVSALPKP